MFLGLRKCWSDFEISSTNGNLHYPWVLYIPKPVKAKADQHLPRVWLWNQQKHFRITKIQFYLNFIVAYQQASSHNTFELKNLRIEKIMNKIISLQRSIYLNIITYLHCSRKAIVYIRNVVSGLGSYSSESILSSYHIILSWPFSLSLEMASDVISRAQE